MEKLHAIACALIASFISINICHATESSAVAAVGVAPDADACRYLHGAPSATRLIDRAKFWSKMEEIVRHPEKFEYDYKQPVKDASGKHVMDASGNPVMKKRHDAISFNDLRSILNGVPKCTIEGIFDYWETSGGGDPKVLALSIATALKESNYTLQPGYIEKFSKTNPPAYAKPDKHRRAYYGRGLTQLTKIENYKTFGNRLGINLVNQPELAVIREYSIRILVDGARLSLFNTKYGKVETYLNDTTSDWVRARGLVNPGSYRKRTTGYLACRFYDAVQPSYLQTAPVQDAALCMQLSRQVDDSPL
ncbi:hypothetical protein PS858_00525 [Pseudomonas fluorescens]|uniref:hypothetical protein n=1 Tax=Pseudomonas fluorescens TaxID=294 RepID=UPI00123EEEBB|nr:hypothetical protein [Pseudomonas fluorescens]VVO55916.1 hypothetical protein PS858_00525 [Pseudomonas fluorescens]